MTLILAESFLASPGWHALSPPAQHSLIGLVRFATRTRGELVVEGTAEQLGSWIGQECGLNHKMIVAGLGELHRAHYIHRSPCPSGTRFVVRVPVVERSDE